MNSDDTLDIGDNHKSNYVNKLKLNTDLNKPYSHTTTTSSSLTASNSESAATSPKRKPFYKTIDANEDNICNNGNSTTKLNASTLSTTSSLFTNPSSTSASITSLNKVNKSKINDTNSTDNRNRIKLSAFDMEKLSKNELIEKWHKQETYIDYIEKQLSQQQKKDYIQDKSQLNSILNKENGGNHTINSMDEDTNESKTMNQMPLSQRESILVMRLTAKEQEMLEIMGQLNELKNSRLPARAQLESTSVDPAVNFMFDKMRKSLDTAKTKLDEMQKELNAWKFTPESTLGKKLMTKCRLLHQENEELGKLTSSGRIAKLEGDLALQKNFSEEMKKSQSDLDEFLLELDEDIEGMQNTIVYLQSQLKESRDQIATLECELNVYKNEQINNKSDQS